MRDPAFQYTWLIWATAFLLPWGIVFAARPAPRRRMLWASVLTAPFGLTEPLFVPAYWNPPSLFDLAQCTGFDIESLIFCFAIGGLGIAGYSALTAAPLRRMDHHARSSPRHRWHLLALMSPIIVFAALILIDWNPIYPGILALVVGALAALLCRTDLWRNTLYGGVVFLVLYAVFLLGLKWLWPGYIEAVWNLAALIDWRPAGFRWKSCCSARPSACTGAVSSSTYRGGSATLPGCIWSRATQVWRDEDAAQRIKAHP